MRRRAYRPDFSGCLEGRSAPSSVAAPAVEPVAFSLRRLNLATNRVQLSFTSYTRVMQTSQLRRDLDSDIAPIPFAQADGLGASIERIVERMEGEIAARAPRAISTALHDAVVTIRASVAARVRAGDVILR